MFHFRPLKALLIAGVVLGFGSGFASLAHHHRMHGGHGCHGQGRWSRDDVQAVAPVAAPAPAPAVAPQTIIVPAAAPQVILVMPNGGTQAVAPVVVQAPAPAAVNVAPAHPAP